MAKGQDQGNGNGPFDAGKTSTLTERANTDGNRSLSTALQQTTFHCCACYERAVAYDHATIARDLLEQAVRTASDIVIDAKFTKEETEKARTFIMKFIAKQEATL